MLSTNIENKITFPALPLKKILMPANKINMHSEIIFKRLRLLSLIIGLL